MPATGCLLAGVAKLHEHNPANWLVACWLGTGLPAMVPVLVDWGCQLELVGGGWANQWGKKVSTISNACPLLLKVNLVEDSLG